MKASTQLKNHGRRDINESFLSQEEKDIANKAGAKAMVVGLIGGCAAVFGGIGLLIATVFTLEDNPAGPFVFIGGLFGIPIAVAIALKCLKILPSMRDYYEALDKISKGLDCEFEPEYFEEFTLEEKETAEKLKKKYQMKKMLPFIFAPVVFCVWIVDVTLGMVAAGAWAIWCYSWFSSCNKMITELQSVIYDVPISVICPECNEFWMVRIGKLAQYENPESYNCACSMCGHVFQSGRLQEEVKTRRKYRMLINKKLKR